MSPGRGIRPLGLLVTVAQKPRYGGAENMTSPDCEALLNTNAGLGPWHLLLFSFVTSRCLSVNVELLTV